MATLTLAFDKPGNEIQAPMAVVILDGLITATFLNLVVVPALFMKSGRKPVSAADFIRVLSDGLRER